MSLRHNSMLKAVSFLFLTNYLCTSNHVLNYLQVELELARLNVFLIFLRKHRKYVLLKVESFSISFKLFHTMVSSEMLA